MGIFELPSNKNDKTQQGSLRNVGEIGSNETIKTFPPNSFKNPDSREILKGKKSSMEKKLIQGLICFFRI